jgi:hypothetical protein
MVSAFVKAQMERAEKNKKKSAKFGAKKVRAVVKLITNGEYYEEEVLFDSQAEYRFYNSTLLPLINVKKIVDLKFHINYELQPKFEKNGKKYRAITYEADFVCTFDDGHVEIIDVKGFSTDIFKLKQRLFEYKFPDKTIKLIMV